MSKISNHRSGLIKQALRSIIAIAFLALLLSVVVRPSAWQIVPAGFESFRAIGERLFGAHLLAFELLSLLLLAALIGAIFLSRRPA